jgi:osmotically-inducible protein OsmY
MRTLLRLILVLVLVAVAAFLVLGFWAGRSSITAQPQPGSIGTSGSSSAEKARERGAELGEKAAAAAAKAQETVAEAALTTKIKAKMALDDSVKARAIDVTTTGSIVTLTGTVRSVPEHDRAVTLARETVGVTQVVDHLRVQR